MIKLKSLPCAISVYLMPAGMGVTGLSQAGTSDQNNVGAQTLYALMTN
jgi:hypothetical protein